MSTIKYRRRVPKVLQVVLNTQELHRTFTSQHEVDVLNKLLDESVVIMNSGLSADITVPTILRNGLEKYVKQSVIVKPKSLHLDDVTALYLAYSKENVTELEQRKRTIFFTDTIPKHFKALKIPLEVSKVTPRDLYNLSQYMGSLSSDKLRGDIPKPQTVNRYIKMFKGLVNYGISTGLYTLPNTMPTLKVTKASEVNREPLNHTEYKLLSKNLYGESLLLLNTIYLSGMRNSEVYKLSITSKDSVPVFNLMKCKGILKTKASYRLVPIHSKLLPHIEQILAFTKQDILRISRHINTTIKELLPNPKGKSLYSARHSVVTNLVKCGVPIERVQQIVGHSNSATMTMGVYFGGYDLQQLLEDIERL